MRTVENTKHGIKCDGCGKVLLYGSIIKIDDTGEYKHKRYCLGCGNGKKGKSNA